MTQLLKQQNGVWQITDNQPTDWRDAEAFSVGSALKLAVDAEPDKAWASARLSLYIFLRSQTVADCH